MFLDESNTVKLGDFGLARAFGVPVNTFSNEVRRSLVLGANLPVETRGLTRVGPGRDALVPRAGRAPRVQDVQHLDRCLVLWLYIR